MIEVYAAFFEGMIAGFGLFLIIQFIIDEIKERKEVKR